jgi:hypothetical protein
MNPGSRPGSRPQIALSPAGDRRRTAAFVCLVFCASALFLYACTFRRTTPIWLMNKGESGIWIDEAARVLDGEVMYRDFFELVGPGVVYCDALFLSLLGRTAAAAMIIPIVVGAALTALLWHLSSHFFNGGVQLVPPLLFVSITYAGYCPGNHKWWMWLFALAAIDVLVTCRRSWVAAAAAGALMGAAVLCTQDMAVWLTLGIFTVFVIRRERVTLIAFTASFLLAVSLVLGCFAAVAGLPTLFYDLVLFPLTQYSHANGGAVFFGGGSRLRALVTWGVVLLSVAGACVAASKREERNEWWWVVVPGLFVLVASSATRTIEPTQTSVRAVLLVITIPAVVQWLRPQKLASFASALLVVIGLAAACAYVVRRQWFVTTRVSTRAGAVWSDVPLAEIAWIEANTVPGEAVFLFPDEGGVFFLTRTRNATPFPYLQDMEFSPRFQIDAAAAAIERGQPRVGFFEEKRLYSGTLRGSSLARLYDYLSSRYVIEGGRCVRITPGSHPTRLARSLPHNVGSRS